MAFNNKNLSVVAYANGFTLWHYKTKEENMADIKNDYFPERIISLMACGDIMMINAKDTTEILAIKTLYPITLGKLGE